MTRYFFALFSQLLCISAFGQINIQGKILDTDSNPVVSANITIKNTADLNRILGFAISKPDGNYSIKLNSPPDSLLITVSKIGYSTKELLVLGQSQTYNFTLEKGDIVLKEIVVQAPPIRRRGDTLSYKVEEFQSASDRSIGDVIKKLPGIETSENGQILYQGKPINRYYIENLNLLDGRYGLVNDNLPHGKVATVQVFENHQPIRALDSLHFSETAAIDIKLRNKVTHTGTIHYGAGYKPFIWDVNITPMLFVPNLQFLGSFQSNSSGKSLVRQFFNFEMVMFQNWLNVPSIATPPFSQQRWLDNQSHAASLNALKKTKKDLELKLNASLILEEQKQRGDYTINYLLTNETVRYSENTYNRFGENQFLSVYRQFKIKKRGILKTV